MWLSMVKNRLGIGRFFWLHEKGQVVLRRFECAVTETRALASDLFKCDALHWLSGELGGTD